MLRMRWKEVKECPERRVTECDERRTIMILKENRECDERKL